MTAFDTHYLKPSAIAERLDLHRSKVYALIKDGTLPHIRIGKAVRVPVAAFDAYVRSLADEQGTAAPKEVIAVAHDTRDAELESRREAFEQETGMDPFEFVEQWKRSEIPDTPENSERAMDALALRTVLQRAGHGIPLGV